jgi:hypothetical protein
LLVNKLHVFSSDKNELQLLKTRRGSSQAVQGGVRDERDCGADAAAVEAGAEAGVETGASASEALEVMGGK